MHFYEGRSHSGSKASPRTRKPIPFLTSPVNDSNIIQDPSSEKGSDPHRFKLRLFKEQDVCTSAELFYDLFFVANLATFSANHEIVDFKSEAQTLPG